MHTEIEVLNAAQRLRHIKRYIKNRPIPPSENVTKR
jgi:hypothetical protein